MPRGRPREFNADHALDAAMMLFWQHGYEGASLAALGEKMDMNMPSVYATFGNKEALFKKALQRYLQQQACYLPNAMMEPTARTVVAALFKGAIDLAMNRNHPDGCLLVHGALATSPAAEMIRQELGGCRKLAESLVRKRFGRAVVQGDLPPTVNAAQLAGYVMTIVWGMSVQAAGGATRAQLHAVATVAMQCVPCKATARRTLAKARSGRAS